ncbi:MAG: STAS domain-containing protein [Anaerolineae bacterium]|nr:STAS domain-containing protein [Anaerolineae bacterium]
MDIISQNLETDVMLVRLNGRLDATTSPEVRATLQKLLEKDEPKIIIDLQEVPFIDSSGLASLVSGLRLAREKNGIIALSGIQPQAQTVFRLTMLDRIFPIHPTYNDARQSLI